jgi:tRNA threonylcarbamoyladenosine biosynthesis protein TsaB
VVGVTTLTAYAAPVVTANGAAPVLSAIDARHDHVYFQLVSGDGTSLIRPRVAPIAEVLEAAKFGAPHLVGNAAGILAARWPADAPPVQVDDQPAPEISWVGWLGAAVNPETALARPYYLRAPDAKPQLNAVPHAQPALS